jgi:hypothetical protein
MWIENTGHPIADLVNAHVRLLPEEEQQEVLEFVYTLAQKTLPPQKSIWEKIRERAARIPDEEWENMPTDGSIQHDHYLYGTPKR